MEEKAQENNNGKMSEERRELLSTLLACLFYILAAAYIPLSLYLPMGEFLSAAIALAVCVLSVVVLSRIARGYKTLIGYTLVLGIFIIFGGMLLLIGLFSAFASASCIFAYLWQKKRTPFVWGLPLIPLIISILLIGNVSGVILSLFTLPCSLLLALSVKNKCARVGAVCRISFGICLSAVLLFLTAVWSVSGEISATAVKELIGTAKEQLISILGSAASEIETAIGYELTSLDVENIIEVSVSSLFNLLPALVITLANIAAYLIHSLYLSIVYVTDEERKEALPMLSFDMSLISAILYILSLVLAFVLASGKTAIYGTAAENILLVLSPGLVLTALAGIRALTVKRGPSCLGTLLYFGVIFLLVSLSVYAIIGVSLAGAILIILTHILKRRSDKEA